MKKLIVGCVKLLLTISPLFAQLKAVNQGLVKIVHSKENFSIIDHAKIGFWYFGKMRATEVSPIGS